MKKLVLYLVPLVILLSSCSWTPEKEIVTVETIIKPTIAIAQKPRPVEFGELKVKVITEANVQEVIQEMKEMQRELLDTIQNQQETINNMVSKVGNTTNNLTNNNNFNINLFLNDKCKDAINFSDFIDRIEISHDDLENNRELGFVNGVTKILMDNLNTMNLYERPIHCTDTKRETLYIKDADEWKKEDGGVKLESAIQEVSRKSIRSLIDWKNENPDYDDLDSDFSKKCIEIQQQSCGSVNKTKTYPKIIQNIARNNTIKNNELKN